MLDRQGFDFILELYRPMRPVAYDPISIYFLRRIRSFMYTRKGGYQARLCTEKIEQSKAIDKAEHLSETETS